MKTAKIVVVLAALAHETRLGIVRLLGEAAPAGVRIAQIATHMELPAPSLLPHLSELQRAGLVARRRKGGSMVYISNVARMNEVARYFEQHCFSEDISDCEPAGAVAGDKRRRRH